ncbi:unnamed protein product [Fusarium graminearum]|nr:unnamed protein product [Fusarium graminearum]
MVSADETSPLINGGASSAHDTTSRRNGNGNGHATLSRDSSTMTFLFDSKHTPGIHNQNIAIRSLAYSWHIAKTMSTFFWSWCLLASSLVRWVGVPLPSSPLTFLPLSRSPLSSRLRRKSSP